MITALPKKIRQQLRFCNKLNVFCYRGVYAGITAYDKPAEIVGIHTGYKIADSTVSIKNISGSYAELKTGRRFFFCIAACSDTSKNKNGCDKSFHHILQQFNYRHTESKKEKNSFAKNSSIMHNFLLNRMIMYHFLLTSDRIPSLINVHCPLWRKVLKTSIRISFLIIPLVIVTVFLFFPLLITVLPTFRQGNSFTLSNYSTFFKDDLNRNVFFRSIRLSVITTAVCMAAGIPAAYYLSRLEGSKKHILNSLILFPLLTNAVVRGFAWISILGKNGLLNQMLLRIGLIKAPVQMLYTESAIVIGSVYLFLPVMISSLTPVMEKINADIEEAAYTLGANTAIVFSRIIIPLALPGIITGSVLVFAGTISAYTTPTLLGGNKKMMLATLLYQQSSTLADWNSAAVISFIMIAASLGIMKIFNTTAASLDKRREENV
jgi:putative spermidine/putrescine transport system permease protein